MSSPKRWIWIAKWDTFQHYPPDPKRGPAWIKDYTAQMHDERYLELTDRQRALLRDLRDIFATSRGRLGDDCAVIARHRHQQTRHSDLVVLNRAGFIEFLSRAALERRLDEVYSRKKSKKDIELRDKTKAVETLRASGNGEGTALDFNIPETLTREMP